VGDPVRGEDRSGASDREYLQSEFIF